MLFVFYKASHELHDAIECDDKDLVSDTINPATNKSYEDFHTHYYVKDIHDLIGDYDALRYLAREHSAELIKALKY